MGYDQWLEQPYQDACRDADALEAAIEQVMEEPEFDPLNVKTFLHAIDDACLYSIMDKLQEELKSDYDLKKGFDHLGFLIYEAVYNHCYAVAENEAVKRYNESLEGQERDF